MQAKGFCHDSQDVHSSIWFLAKDELYATVKPYTLAFTPDSAIPRENITREEKSKNISDIRAHLDEIIFDRNGFMVLEMPEHPEAVDWDSKMSVEKEFYPAVTASIEDAFPGASCIILHHQVCVNLQFCKSRVY
jgi:hypothetical protein